MTGNLNMVPMECHDASFAAAAANRREFGGTRLTAFHKQEQRLTFAFIPCRLKINSGDVLRKIHADKIQAAGMNGGLPNRSLELAR